MSNVLPITPQVKKIWQRFSLISTSAIYRTSSQFFNLGISVLVVRLVSPAIWGEMVPILLWTGIATNVIAWGNKDFLMMQFSLSPSSLKQEWQRSFGSRSLLFVLALCILFFFPITVSLKFWIALYCTARFMYLSYDPLIIFRRAFLLTVILESAGFILIAIFVFIFRPSATAELFSFFAFAEVAKTIAILIYFKVPWLPVLFKDFDWGYFAKTFSFFILYFSGMLASKIDLIFVTHFFSKEGIAQYQVLINFLLVVQGIPAIIILPFVKNIYRMNAEAIKKMSLRLFVAGIFISCLSVLVIKLAVQFAYDFTYVSTVYLYAFLLVLPAYYYSPIVFRLFKDKQRHVVIISLSYILFAALSIFIFLKLFDDKIAGVLAALALAQWAQGLVYHFVWDENKITGGEKILSER